MPSYTQCLHHIVFATKQRRPVLAAENRRELYAYMHGIMKRLNCHLYRLNGVEDHIHILVGLHPEVALASFVQQVKLGSGNWMRGSAKFPHFEHWQEGYGAFTKSWDQRDKIIDYIKGQEEHHRTMTFEEELRRLVEEAGLTWDDRHLP